jgi:hypothetical protein
MTHAPCRGIYNNRAPLTYVIPSDFSSLLTFSKGKLHDEKLRNFAKYNYNNQVKEDERVRGGVEECM